MSKGIIVFSLIIGCGVMVAASIFLMKNNDKNNEYDEDAKEFIANIDEMVKTKRITSEEGREKKDTYLKIKPDKNQRGGKRLTKKSKFNRCCKYI